MGSAKKSAPVLSLLPGERHRETVVTPKQEAIALRKASSER